MSGMIYLVACKRSDAIGVKMCSRGSQIVEISQNIVIHSFIHNL